MKRILLLLAVLLGSIAMSAQPRSEEQAKQIASVSHRHRVKEIELYRGDSVSFENRNDMQWLSSDQYVVKVKNGIITGNHIGTAIVTASNTISKDYIIVKVKPKYMLYDDPILDFGLSRQSILDKETHRLISVVADSLDLAYDYSHDQYEIMIIYEFEKKNELKSVSAIIQEERDFDGTDVANSILKGFYNERFDLMSGEDGFLFIDRSIDNIRSLINLKNDLTNNPPNNLPLLVQVRPCKKPKKWIKVTYTLPQKEASEVHHSLVFSGEDKDKWGDFLSHIIYRE